MQSASGNDYGTDVISAALKLVFQETAPSHLESSESIFDHTSGASVEISVDNIEAEAYRECCLLNSFCCSVHVSTYLKVVTSFADSSNAESARMWYGICTP